MNIKRFLIGGMILQFFPVIAQAQEPGKNDKAALAIFLTLAPIVLVAVVLWWLVVMVRRTQKPIADRAKAHMERQALHMERVEQSLDRIVKALEKKD